MQCTVILNDYLIKQVLNDFPNHNLDDLLNCALQEYLKNSQNNFEQLLNQTQGIWQQGDGLAYQMKIREEWN